jgi:hypothetical protein
MSDFQIPSTTDRLRSYVRDRTDADFIRLADMARDTNTSAHEVLAILEAAGVVPFGRTYQRSALIDGLAKRL